MKIICVGINYADHSLETGVEAPAEPLLFGKFENALIGPGDAIVLPPEATQIDSEAELAVEIGRKGRRIAEDDALEFVAGYRCANDVSARTLQFADKQWLRGKSFDTFCPLGPVLVTPDEVPDPQRLGLRTRVNGVTVQDSATSEMIFSVAEILSYCASCFTLEPGDLVLTGTPWGCGGFMSPPRHLGPGDVMECEIDRLGTLRNPVVAAL
jgi:2-keto-4-pentenoate hydratase/2-oxohepta-3-ene-1,7-dioic acid hydratase in catechol pathway